jgi:hypothetical protein
MKLIKRGKMKKFVARFAIGAATRSDEVLLEIHELLANLAPAPVTA